VLKVIRSLTVTGTPASSGTGSDSAIVDSNILYQVGTDQPSNANGATNVYRVDLGTFANLSTFNVTNFTNDSYPDFCVTGGFIYTTVLPQAPTSSTVPNLQKIDQTTGAFVASTTVFADINLGGRYWEPQGIATDGTYLYVFSENFSSHGAYVTRVNISTFTQDISSVQLTADLNILPTYGKCIIGGYLYIDFVEANGGTNTGVVKIAIPAVSVISTYTPPPGFDELTITTDGTYLYVALNNYSTGACRVDKLDTSFNFIATCRISTNSAAIDYIAYNPLTNLIGVASSSYTAQSMQEIIPSSMTLLDGVNLPNANEQSIYFVVSNDTKSWYLTTNTNTNSSRVVQIDHLKGGSQQGEQFIDIVHQAAMSLAATSSNARVTYASLIVATSTPANVRITQQFAEVYSSITNPNVRVSQVYAEVLTLPILTAISNFSPSAGSPGDVVVIYGYNFTGTSSVQFNGTPATFTVISNSIIYAIIPNGATTGQINVNGVLSAYSFIIIPVLLGPIIYHYSE
jgi:hypothetical protein